VLRDDASLVKTLTEPQTETFAIELPELFDPPRPRSLVARLWALLRAPLTTGRPSGYRSEIV